MSIMLTLLLPALACQSPKESAPPVETGSEVIPGDTDKETEESGNLDTVDPGDDTSIAPQDLCHINLTCGASLSEGTEHTCSWYMTQGGERIYDGSALVGPEPGTGEWPKPRYQASLLMPPTLLSASGEIWQYFDGGVLPGEKWYAPGYDSSKWLSGPSPLGYGDGMATTISYGPDENDKYITSYFRRQIEWSPKVPASRLSVTYLRDDGIIIYLNGAEIIRENLPEGEIGCETVALASVADETTYVAVDLDPALLLPGTNTFAAEVHQSSGTSSDTAFDLTLSVTGGSQSLDLASMGVGEDWLFDGAYPDPTLMRSKLATDIFQSMGGYAPDLILGDLALEGEWKGVFSFGEALGRGEGRVPIAEDDGTGASFIIRATLDEKGVVDNTVGGVGGSWDLVYPGRADGVDTGVSTTVMSWQAAVLGPDPGNAKTGVFAWMDMDAAVDFVLLMELSRKAGGFGQDVVLWKDASGLLVPLPWNMNLGFGAYPVSDCGYEGWLERPPWVTALLQDTDFMGRLVTRWGELRDGTLADIRLHERVSAYQESLGNTALTNYMLWPIDQLVWPLEAENQLCPVKSWESSVIGLDTWLKSRAGWMDANIAAYGG